jgi:hypothetical protein
MSYVTYPVRVRVKELTRTSLREETSASQILTGTCTEL